MQSKSGSSLMLGLDNNSNWDINEILIMMHDEINLQYYYDCLKVAHDIPLLAEFENNYDQWW
jgi:hypothetical protein